MQVVSVSQGLIDALGADKVTIDVVRYVLGKYLKDNPYTQVAVVVHEPGQADEYWTGASVKTEPDHVEVPKAPEKGPEAKHAPAETE